MGKESPAIEEIQETWFRYLGQEEPLEEVMSDSLRPRGLEPVGVIAEGVSFSRGSSQPRD